MANQSDRLLVDLKITPPIGDSFIHSFSNEAAVVMNGLLITDSLNRSKLQIRSLMKHSCMLFGDTHQMIRISLELLLTSGETRLSRGASSPLARILLFIHCLLIVLIKFLNVEMYYISILYCCNF